MADHPTSPLIRLKQKLLPSGLRSSPTVRVVSARPRPETEPQTKTRGCLTVLTRYRRPYTTTRRGGEVKEGRVRVPGTVGLASSNLVLGPRTQGYRQG